LASRGRIDDTLGGPDSNNRDGGMNGTPTLYQPADVVVD
jgi:phage-related minor tail protein